MKTSKLVLSLLVVCLPVLSVWAGQWTYNSGSATLSHDTSLLGLYASRNGTNLTVTGVYCYNPGTPSALPLSDPMPGYALVSIGDYAFQGHSLPLTSVSIPGSVTNIGDGAFAGLTGLTSVEICKGVVSIGDWALGGCTALVSVTIPDSVTSIGAGAFGSCASLTTIKVSENNPNYASFNDVLFNKNLTTLIQCPGAFSGHFNIPDNVTSIVEQAFARCSYLTSVTIPNGVTNIGESAFSECIGLTGVVIPDSVISVGDDAFFGCTVWDVEWNPIGGLSSVVIGNGVKNIGAEAFLGCASLTSIMIPDSVLGIGEYAFGDCYTMTSAVIGSGVTNLGAGAFSYCRGLTNIVIGNNVTDIGESAFEGCASLTEMVIPDSVFCIGDCAFANCYALTNAVIGGGVTNIGYGAFQYCSGLTSLVIGSGVTGIGDWAFEGCESLTGVTIRCGEDALASDTFYGCDNIRRLDLDMPGISSQWGWNAYGVNRGNVEALVIGNNVTSIYYNAFAGMTGLTSVVIGSGVTDIGDYAFQGCTSLSRVTILCDGEAFMREYTWTDGNGVVHSERGMKNYAFDGCVSIRELLLDMPTVPQNFGSAFFKQGWYNYETGEFEIQPYGPTVSTNSVSVIFGDSTTTIEDNAFYGCVGPASLIFGSGTVNINDWGFQDCVGLTNIVFGSGAVSINGGFYDCDGLTDIVFGSGAVSINGGFQNCDGLTNLVFGSGAVSINGGFYDCDGLTDIVFVSGVTNIGAGAFSYCAGLTNIVIGSSVTGIGDYAFAECPGLTSVTIPGSVTSVGEAPFAVCSSLTNISVAAENPVCRDICGVLYSKDASTLLTFPAGRGGEYAVPDGTARLGHDALTGAALTGLWLPASVTNVGENVAWFGWPLFNKAVPVNNSSALFVGFSLTNISVAAENPVYRDICGVLYSKDGTALLSYPSGRAGGYAVPPGVLRFSAGAFAGRSSLTDITIPGSVLSIESRAFWNCGGLTNIVFGPGTADIGTGAFAYCTGLTSVVIGNVVTSIGDGAFYGCASLTNVVFGAGVTNIGYGAFVDCAGLTSVTVPGGATHVGDFAFGRDYLPGSMTNAVMSNVRVMGPNTFSGQPLTEVVFTGAEPPRIVEEFWTQTNGVYSNWVGDAGADWVFSTWQGEGDFTVLVPAAYLNNWVADVADPVWRGRPVQTLESARGISGTFDFAVDDRLGLEWTTAGWFAQSAVRYSGPMALQSGDIVNGQTSTVQTIVKNAGTLTFRYRVSSEEDYDFLNVYLDDVLVLQESGIRAEWMEKRIVVRGIGKHKIRWDYVKDDSYSEGADCAWVDAVVWEPGTASTEVPVPYAWLDGFGLSEGGDYEAVALADTDGDGYPAWAEYVAGTDPTDDASVLRALISVQDGVPSVTWEPDLGSARAYTVEGKASLTGNWQSPANATHRFFRVKVSMGIP